MADDPLRDLFGASAPSSSDPLDDLFGTAPMEDFAPGADPLRAKPKSPIVSAIEGKSPDESAQETEHKNLLHDIARTTPKHNVDTWGDRITKFGTRAADLFTMQITGLLQQAVENAGSELAFDPNRPLSTAEREQLVTDHAKAVEQARKKGDLPGQREFKAAQQDLAENEYDFGGTTDYYVTLAAESLAQMVPTIAASVATRGRTLPGLVTLYEQQAGQKFGEARSAGRSTAEANLDAGVYGLAESIPEAIPLGFLMKPGGKFLKRLLVTSGLEGTSEILTAAVELGYDKGTINPDMTWEEAWPQLRDSGILGSLLGGSMTVAEAPFHRKALSEEEPLELTDVFGPNAPPPDAQPGTDDLGRAPTPKAPEPGRSYNQADAIAELGMSSEEAAQFVATGKDPRPTNTALEEHGFTPGLTQDDQTSPIPDEVIAGGKDILGTALKDNSPVKAKRFALDENDHLTADRLVNFKRKVGGAENNTGNPNAKNPLSSASGNFQFTDGTWTGLGGDLANKNDPATQDRMMDKLTGQNFNTLRKAGFKTTDGNLYLAHFLGSGGAVNALSHPNEPVSAAVQKANPFTQGWTNAQLAAWADKKMGGTGALPDGAKFTLVPEDALDNELALTVEDTLAAAGIDLNADEEAALNSDPLGADVQDFQPEQRIDVTQNGATVPGTVKEVYGEGPERGVKVALDDGTTFDEVIERAREYGARLTHPVTKSDAAQPQLHPGRYVDTETGKEFTVEKVNGATFDYVSDEGNGRSQAGTVPTLEALRSGRIKPLADPLASAFGSHVGEKIDDEWTAFHPSTGTLGIPRAEMPQVKGEHRGAMVNFLEARGISATEETVPLAGLKPSQAEFSQKKADSWDKGNVKLEDRKLLVSSDGYVLDGHHQWVKGLERHGTTGNIIRLGATAKEALAAMHEFPSSTVSEGATSAQSDEEARNETELDYNTTERHERVQWMEAAGVNSKLLPGGPKHNSGTPFRELPEVVQTLLHTHRRAERTPETSADDHAQFVREDTLSVLNARAKMNAKFNAGEVDAFTKGVAAETGYGAAWRKEIERTNIDEPHLKAAYNKGRAAAVKELRSRGVAPIGKATESTAPEHAAVGVDDRELSEIVTAFNDAQAEMGEGDELITHIFDAPKPNEIVRLNQKSRVYHQEHGWMTPAEAAKKIREWEERAVAQGRDPKSRSYNGDKIVLSFFDLSGEWSAPWEQAGYQVWRFDIQDDPEMGDVNNFSAEFFGDWFGDFDGLDVYAILAACPCTDFASSGARHFAAKDADGRTVASVKLVHQTLAAIEYFKPAVWAIENPVGRIEKLGGLPPWRLSFDPNDIGETYTKKTLLWGRFNADLEIAPVEPVEGSKMHKQFGGKSLKTKNARSVTPEGFAYSFFLANNAIDHPAMAIANKYDRLDRDLIEQAVKAGITEAEIDEAVEDYYYQDLDDDAANAAIEGLLDGAPKPTGDQVADQPTEAPANVAAAEALRAKAEPHQAELAAWGERWNARGDEYGFINPGLKSAARIIEKLEKEGYESLDEIKDVARAGFKITERDRATDLVVSAQRTFGAENVTDKGWRMVDGDYFDRKLIIAWPDGTKAEIQIVPDALEEFRHGGGGSDLYAKWRSTERGAEKDALLAQMEAGYAKAAAGTSWESLFNELKSARGNASRAAASESETPSLVANPGAGRQTLADDQTSAQDLPEATPDATSRSSTSKSDTPSIGSNVGNADQVGNVSPPSAPSYHLNPAIEAQGVTQPMLDAMRVGGYPAPRIGELGTLEGPDGGAAFIRGWKWAEKGLPRPFNEKDEAAGFDAYQEHLKPAPAATRSSDYGASNKIVSRERADIARAIIRDKLKNQLNSGFDPELLSAGMQLAAFHLEAGARKFADFAKAIADDLGTQAKNLKPYLAAWYNGARDMLEAHQTDVSDMDTSETVKAFVALQLDTLGEPSLPETVDGIGDNGVENAGTSTDQGTQEPDRTGDAREAPGDAPATGGDRGTGQGSDDAGAASGGELRTGEEPSIEPRAASEPEPGASGSDQRDNAGVERSSPRSARSSRRVRDTTRGTDFRAGSGALARSGSWLDAANRNLDIIELVNRLDAEGRPATADEQALLAKWVGWGSSEIRNNLFRSVDRRTMTITVPMYGAGEWTDTIKRAADLIKGPDLETALQSVQYAHYTSEGVIRAMWDAFERMGFGGGRILEPGMGIGHFFTAAPDGVAEHSTYTGVELDKFSAKVASYLLPQENIIQGDYTKQAFPDGFFDAAIGNPPFAAIKVTNDPAYKKMRLSLHNYFFVKTLDKVRPGGLLAFITSRYTMDAVDPKQRQFMADRADLVGAIRLPQTAFKQNAGTDVVTDVLFFQRRAPGAEPAGQDWVNIKPVTVDGQKVNISEYFAAHPEMVLGKHKLHRGMYTKDELTVEPYASKGAIEKQFAEAAGKLPESIYTEQPKAAAASAEAKTFERDFAPSSSKEGGLYVKDGKLLVVDRGSGVPVEALYEKLKPADHEWLKGYTKLRDLLKEAQKAQLTDAADWEAKLDALRKEYGRFTKKHGRIMEFTAYESTTVNDDGDEQTVVHRRFKWAKLLFDVESPLVESLERITDAGEIEDGPFLKGRTLNKPTRPAIETVDDALAVTLDEVGKLDLAYIAKLSGITQDEAVERLGERIYQTPAGEWQTADEYLSGNVLQKLEEAQEAAKTAPDFQRNVEALIKVQPKPLTYDRIAVKLGAPWLKPETITQFAEEVLGAGNVPVSYERATAHWHVEGSNARWQRSATSDYGTKERSALELLDALLNNRTIKITYKDSDGKTHTDQEGTAAAVEAAKKIEQRFKTWLWEDSARTSEYVEIYNRSYNNIAPRRFDGSHLTLPGLSALFKPHDHVKRAVWRIIQTGNTYLAHAVGAGKTAEQIIGGQEQRRLGLIKKPMHVVPNHMLKQFQQEFLQLYPAANIMVADEKAFHTSNRRRFLAQAALNDPDAIILTHSSFGKIDTSPEMRARIVADMVSELEIAFQDAKDEGAPRHLVSRLEKQIETLKRRFESKTQGSKDKLLTFDEMGVDQIILDEAHEFRKLDFATNRSAKGIDASGSARALDLFIKSQYLEQVNPGRSLILASGTPVTNTMAELYTVMKYMDLKGLERDGIAAFDAWANMFGEVAPGYERNAAGGYEIVERFSKFVNVPELMKRVRNFMDVLTSAQLGDLVVRPKIKDGGPQNVIAPMSDELDHYMKVELDTRLETSRKWKPSKEQPGNPDPVINIITDARLSSIDMRFINPNAKSDPNSKLNQMITKIAEKHKEFAGLTYSNKDGTKQPRKGAAQIVFSPVGLGEQVAAKRGFDVRAWIDGELVRQGVKKSEIGWMSDANTHAKKEQLQKDVRSGKVRVLIGSPKNMGTGLNVQDRLKVLHFLAPPWYPADVTQPHGRIERQGNQNTEAEIYWYATEGTYDSTGWGMVARKQKFIDDAMAGDDSVRSLEDISEVNMFEMAAALAAGDDRVIRIAELGGEVERLTRLKGAHSDTQRTLRTNINWIETRELPRAEQHLADLKQAQAARDSYPQFSLTLGGTTYEKHGEAGDALIAAAQTAIDSTTALERTEIGKLYGKHPVEIDATRGGHFQLFVRVGGIDFEAGRPFEKTEDLNNVGIVRSLELAVQSIPSSIQQTAREITELQQRLEASKRKYGAPFPEEAMLNDAIAEKNRLEQEMAAETAAKNAPPQQAQAPAPKPSKLASEEAARRYDGDRSFYRLHDQFVGGAAVARGERTEPFHAIANKREQEAFDDGVEWQKAQQPPIVAHAAPARTSFVLGEANRPAFTAELERQLRMFLPNDAVALRTLESIPIENGQFASGQYHPWLRMISIAENALEPAWTLAHEGIHAMRSLKLFTKEEWQRLVDHVWHNNPENQERIRARWAGLRLNEEQFQEEAVAEEFGEYWNLFEEGNMRAPGSIKGAAQKLFMRAAMRALRFIGAIARTIQKMIGTDPKIQNAAEETLQVIKLLEQIRKGHIGSRPIGYGGQEAASAFPVEAYENVPLRPNDDAAKWTPERIKRLVRQYAVDHNPTKTKSYVAWIKPSDFLDVTTPAGPEQDAIRGNSQVLDREQLAREVQTPFLFLEESQFNPGEFRVKGHEGRHRMAALEAAGVERVPVVLERRDIGWSDLEPISSTLLFPQRYSGDKKGAAAIALRNLVPLTYANREQLEREFGGEGPVQFSVMGPTPTPATPDFGGDTERRWNEAKKGIGDGPGMLENARAWWDDLTGGFTRHWRDLPNTPRFADVGQQLRKLEAAPHAAMAESIRYLRSLVEKMNAKEYDLFSRKVVLDDLAWDAGEGRDLPFGFTPSTLKAARVNIDALVNANPKLVRAVRERKAHNARIADAMVEAGVLTKEQIKNPAYFRHMVLDYARHEAALARSPSSIKSPYWAKRMGSTLDINANLLEAELDWLQKAQIDIQTANTIEWIKNSDHNQRDQLQARARADNKAKLDALIASNPSARKEDGHFRSMIARGYQIVKDELESGNLDPLPPHLRSMAADIVNGRRDGEPPFALMAWILDNGKPGGMGAGMVLKYTGLRKQWQRTMLGDAWRDTSDIKGLVAHYKPEGMKAWQPKEGRHLFTAKTISESALDMFVSKLADTATPGIDREELSRALGTVRQQLVVGGDRYTMVIPEELAATLDEFGDRRGEGMVARFFGGIQGAWKQWQLINPRRYLKYNLNNQTGDLDAIIAGNPGALRKVGKAWTMLRDASKGNPSARYTEALERGVFTSALSAQEIPDINRLSAFRHLTEGGPGLRPDKLMVAGIQKVWRALQDSTNFRESLFRLAAYLDYVEKIESGTPQMKIGYGASIPRIVDAVTDPKDKAALLARDLIGDYGAISVAGGWLRRYLIPFWSWTEINTRRYWRLTGNAFTVSKARGLAVGGGLGAMIALRSGLALYTRMAVVYAILYAWNHLLFGDEEDELSEEQAAQLHLIIGRDQDGKVISLRTQGALSDVLHLMGFTDAMAAFNKWQDGQGSLGAVATDMAKAPINRVGTAITPLVSEPFEQALRLELWPDMFEPRVIHDRLRHLAQTFSAEHEYDAIADKPSRGYAQSWLGSLVYKRDPEEMAYDEARSIAYDWLERTRGGGGGGGITARGEALRDYRLALRYGDQDAAVKALKRYEELGGTKKSLGQSIKRAHPLGPIAKKDRKEFLASLTDEQLETFAEAERYWQEVFVDDQ